MCKVDTVRDTNAGLIARQVFNEIIKLTGRRPHFVMRKVSMED